MWLHCRWCLACGMLWLRAGAGSRPGGRSVVLRLGVCGRFGSIAEGGGRGVRPAAHLPSFASSKEGRPRKDDPAARVPHRPVGRWGQPAMLGPGVHRGTPCVRPSGELRSDNRGESVHDARVLRHALTPGPALLGTVRRGWKRAPYGPLLRSARVAVAALGLGRALAPPVGSALREPTFGAAAQQQPSLTPLPTPAGCAEKRRAWGGCVCRRTHALRDLARRGCLSGVRRTQRVPRRPPQARASQVAPVRPTGRTGDADWGPPSLW